jgi:hypothetical protein
MTHIGQDQKCTNLECAWAHGCPQSPGCQQNIDNRCRFAKGSSEDEKAPRDPPPSQSAAFIFGILVAALAYLASVFDPPVRGVLFHPARPNSIANLGYASYRGLLNDSAPNVVSWLGVPYALPPRRFRAPQALDETPREHEIQDTQEYPPLCVQGWSPWMGRGSFIHCVCCGINLVS